MTDRVRKQCAKCGWAGLAGSRVRRCHQVERRFGTPYFCWGKLAREPVARKPPRELETAAIAESIMDSAIAAASAPSYQHKRDDAAKQLARAEKAIDIKTRAMAKLAKAIHQLRLDSIRYAKRATMSDAQFAAASTSAKERAATRASRKTKRGIVVGGGR